MQYILMKYAYLFMVAVFSPLFAWNMLTAKSRSSQISCAIVLVPLLLRLFLIH